MLHDDATPDSWQNTIILAVDYHFLFAFRLQSVLLSSLGLRIIIELTYVNVSSHHPA